MAAGRRPQRACGARPGTPAGSAARASQFQTRGALVEQLAEVEVHADLVLALRLAQQTLAEWARTVICQSRLACEGLVHPSPQLLEEIQCELRAIKADRPALARLPR